MQKKILLAVIICTIVTTVDAQIKKGAVLLGGQVGFNTSTTKNTGLPDSKNTGVNFSPAVGKAVKDNLIVGGDILFAYGKSESLNTYSQQVNTYGIGFFVRKYKELGKGFYVFGQTRAGVSYNKQQNNDAQTPSTSYTAKGYGAQIAIYPGVAYTVSKRLQLEAGFNNLAYIQFDHFETTYNSTVNPSSKTNNFSLGSSLSNFSGITLGFRVLLN